MVKVRYEGDPKYLVHVNSMIEQCSDTATDLKSCNSMRVVDKGDHGLIMARFYVYRTPKTKVYIILQEGRNKI